MDKPKEILCRIDDLINQLSSSLSQDDLDARWNEDKRIKYLDGFKKIKEDIENGKIAKHQARSGSILRALDSSGIKEGPLFESAIKIENMITAFGSGS